MMNILKNFQLNKTCTQFLTGLVDFTHLFIDEFFDKFMSVDKLWIYYHGMNISVEYKWNDYVYISFFTKIGN